ncbi:MAG: hypothetical protein ACREVV_11400 [Steroidobacteraceae bacterium]
MLSSLLEQLSVMGVAKLTTASPETLNGGESGRAPDPIDHSVSCVTRELQAVATAVCRSRERKKANGQQQELASRRNSASRAMSGIRAGGNKRCRSTIHAIRAGSLAWIDPG